MAPGLRVKPRVKLPAPEVPGQLILVRVYRSQPRLLAIIGAP